MRRPELVEEVRGRLLRNGFGRDYATRTAWELHDHWMDLVQEGLRQGQSKMEAEAEARKRLGDPAALARQLARRMRQSSWLGRNPTIGFATLALAAIIVWWTVLFLALGSVSGLFAWDPKAANSAPPSMTLIGMSVELIRGLSFLAVPWIICHVAQRFFCGWQGALWGCLVLAFHNATHIVNLSVDFQGRQIMWGYSASDGGPSLLALLAPICVFAIFILWNGRSLPGQAEPSPKLS